MMTPTRILTGLLVTLALGTPAQAAIITYMVEFGTDDGMGGFTPITGKVEQTTVIDWRVTATIEEGVGETNLGIASWTLDMTDDTGDGIAPANIDSAFANASNYFEDQGDPSSGMLEGFGVFKPLEDGDQVGAGTGTFTLATGSYQLNTLGVHNLTLLEGEFNGFFATPGETGPGTAYDEINFVNAAVTVVPEPASMLLASTLVVPGVIGIRRRRRQKGEPAEQAV